MYDLNITKIINLYYRNNINWQRNKFDSRPFDAIVLFTDGEIDYFFPNTTITARKGDLLFLPNNAPYSGIKRTETVSYYVVDFLCAETDEFEKLIAPAVFTLGNYEVILSKFSKALQLWDKQPSFVFLKLKSFLYSIVSEAFYDNSVQKSTTPVEKLQEYIIENLSDSSLKIKNLCKKFFISESQLRRNFIKSTGLSPNEYILTLRINKAKNELSCTDKTVGQIAAECGFSSPYYFSRCFSESTGITPSKYRRLTSVV